MDKDVMNDEIIRELVKKDESESPMAYTAFLFWAGLPASERSGNNDNGIRKTSEAVGLELSTIKLYRAQYKWDERANLLDAHFYKLQFNRRLELLNESNQKFAAETKEIQEKAVQVAKKALAAADMLLDTLPMANKVQETDWVLAKQKDGTFKSVPTRTIIQMDAKASDIAPLIRVAVETPMKAIGLPTEVIRPNVVPNVAEVEKMSDEDIAQQRELIQREMAKLSGKAQDIPGVQ